MRSKVIILGGGVAGMSAAHELAERGFRVEVFEKGSIPGGKARSLPAVGEPSVAVVRGRPPLPGEHGFRFFPGFYRHIVDTMQRIPLARRCVADNLVATDRVHVARFGRSPVFYPARFPQSLPEALGAIHFLLGILGGELDIPPLETAEFVGKVFQIVSSCWERRLVEYEKIAWWNFVDAASHSLPYQNFFANGFTRSLVAAKARRASTKTIGDIFVQVILSALRPSDAADRVLNGPTNKVWIDPWLSYLRSLGVSYHFGAQAQSIQYRGGSIQSVRFVKDGRTMDVEGDYFVLAVPVERTVPLISPEMENADPSLRSLPDLSEYVEWMNGIQFHLTEDRPLVHGHSIYLDTPWALTSVSQAQFWPNYPLDRYADGRVRGMLSVCVSDWDVPGLNGKRADECTISEVKDEVWQELKLSVNQPGEDVLSDDILHSWFLDPSVTEGLPGAPGMLRNSAPLLVNYIDTWKLRPEAVTRIPNLFLASDYVRTYTDIATMEAANEAARRAVNGILDASGSNRARCAVWNLHEPEILAPLRAYDLDRFRRGLPWDATAVTLAEQLAKASHTADLLLARTPGVGDAVERLRQDFRQLLVVTGGTVNSGAPAGTPSAAAAPSDGSPGSTIVRILSSERPT